MASAGLSRAVGKIIIGCLLIVGVINVGNVVANEKISPQVFNALLTIMGKPVDSDDDGVNDFDDDFPNDPAETRDTDGDGVGDNADEFPTDAREFRDSDGDGVGNNADPDDDNDNVNDDLDAFPLDPNESVDTDDDGIGNNADPDDDNDNVDDDRDAFPLDPNESVDTDVDGIGNNADPDDDNDNVEDALDAFPLDPEEWLDTDKDGIGNNADTDDDNDEVEDVLDAFPLDPSEWLDTDKDGIGNNADPDDDNDTVEDALDAFPLDPNESLDTDNDGVGNNADEDDDGDGVSDLEDSRPLDPAYSDKSLAEFSAAFGGAVLEAAGQFLVPAGAESWAGFANENTAIYPLVFEFGGKISFKASVGTDIPVDVRFRLERQPYSDADPSVTEPSFNTSTVTITGSELLDYAIEIPSQGTNSFESLILYIDSRDVSVTIEEIRPEPAPDPTLAIMTGAFDGFVADGDYFEFPSSAAVYAGVANTNMSMYPLSFPQGGDIEFRAGVPNDSGSATVYFRFEVEPYPNNLEFFDTESVIISGPETDYSIAIPPQDPNQEFRSMLMYIVERDQPVLMKSIHVRLPDSETNDADGDGVVDSLDAFPNDPAASVDSDGDGQPDDWNDSASADVIAASDLALDQDDDNDGIPDAEDSNPLAAHEFFYVLANFGAFGGAIIEADGDYIVPTDAESFAAFINLSDENYPITLPYGGRISFTASVPSGNSADLRFRLESIYGEFDTFIETSIVTVSGATANTYNLDIPPQGATNFGSLLMYLLTRDEAVKVEEVYLEAAPAPVYARFDGAFDGFIADGDYFEFPSSAASYAGVANTNTDLYPLFFPNGGEIRFMAEGPLEGIDPGVFFLLENAPYPNNTPSFGTDIQIVSGGATEYSLEVAPQDPDQGFESLVMYLTERDAGVRIWNVEVIQRPDGDIDSDGDGVLDANDAFPTDPAASVDTDGDGMPDDWNDGASAIVIGESPLTVDDDDDNDGIPDVDDRDPLYPHYFYGTSAFFDLPFGGATLEENGNYLVPASAEAFAGYANSETYQYPMVFEYGGELVFDAFVPSGEAVDVRFRFERKPYDENDASATEPSFETEPLTISGALPQTYRVEIPPQGSNTFSSLILYIDTRDVAVNFNYAYINVEPEPMFATFDGVFGGFIADNEYFFFPSDAEAFAGVANTNMDLYPLIFPAGGQISFMAEVPVGGFDTSVYFRFENLPYPDNEPFFDTETRVISGEPARYVIDIPATGYEQTYSSFLMYIVERDQGVKVWDVEVESFYETEVDSDNDGYADSYDAFPDDPAAAIDTDLDGMPDDWNVDATEQQIIDSALILDDDDDNDGVTDEFDAFPYDAVASTDTDGDGMPDTWNEGATETEIAESYLVLDNDDDNDGIPDSDDANPLVPDDMGPQIASFIGFEGAQVVSEDNFLMPSSAPSYAGFANTNAALYPITFPEGGRISFVGSVADGGSADVRFRLERLPYDPNDSLATEPSINTGTVTVSGAAPVLYELMIEPQGENSFSSFLMFIDTLDVTVTIQDVMVDFGEPPEFAQMTGVFDGFIADGDTFTFPTDAAEWAGVANENINLYPLSFPEGGEVRFRAAIPEGGAATNVYFLFEANPYPDNTPSFGTEKVTISGGLADYNVQIPPQDPTQEYNSLVMYILERDRPVMIKDIEVVSYGDISGPGPLDSDMDGIPDAFDAFPTNPAASEDTDGDGMPDDWNPNASAQQIVDSGLTLDEDDDNDGVSDYNDAFPKDPAASLDNDYDGMPDDWNEGATEQQIADSPLTVDEDDDNDGIPDVNDPEPLYPHYFYGTSTQFSLPFGGAVVQDNGELLVPASAEAFAGFANSDTYHYPMLFTWGGRIYLDASVPSGGSADLRFRLERLPYDESDPTATEPSYETETITVSGAARQTYLIDIPPLGDTTFESLILYIDTRDVAVDVGYPYFEAAEEPIFAKLDGAFEGFIAEGDYFEFPTGAADYAGVANTNPDFYPIYLPGGGTLSFMAEVPDGGPDTTLYFRFENAPYPNNEPYFNSEAIVVSGGPQRYTIELPARGWDQSYNSFLMYLLERDQGVKVWDVSIEVQYDIDSDGDGIFDEYDAFPEDPAASLDSDYDGMPDDWNPNATDEQIASSPLIIDDDDDNDGIPDVSDPDPVYPNYFYGTIAQFTATFGGAVVQADGSFLVPSDADAANGFVNTITDQYPMLFTYGGRLVFEASVPSGESADIRFRLERKPYDANDPSATEPSYETESITVAGSTWSTYYVDIPPQGANTFESLLLYLDTRDVAVKLEYVILEAAPEPIYAEFTGAFEGFIADGNYFEFPSSAASFAGVANTNGMLYPIYFPFGGEVSFTAEIPEGGTDTSIFFRFENAPYPNNVPSFDSETVLISGGPTRYTIDIPAQGWDQAFNSMLMYIIERDQGVIVSDVEVIGYYEGEIDSDGDGVPDYFDDFPYDPAASRDTDRDGMPDDWNEGATEEDIANSYLTLDDDDDNDGIPDNEDANPLVPDYVLAFFADFSGAFNGAVIDEPFTYRVPADASADAGFANINHDLYPFIFSSGGRISFQAWVPSGESADVHFRFEKAPYPDTEPSFSTETVTISGTEPSIYTVAIPPQGMDSFQSLILYIETRDVAVVIDGALVEDSPTPSLAIMSGAFGGFVADGPFLYNPSSADASAGVANENPLLYPLSFPEGGEITFIAAPLMGPESTEGPASTGEPSAVSVYFRFENAPFPDNEPSFNTEPVEIYGPPGDYVVSIPPQPTDQTFSSFLMFIEGVDQGVVAWDINVSMMSGPTDSDGDGVLDAQDAFPDDPAASIDTDNDGQPDNWNTGATDTQIAESTLILDNDDDNDGVEDALDPDPTDPNVRGMALSGKVVMETLVTLDGDTNNADNGYAPNDNAGSPAPDLTLVQKIGDAQVVFGYLAYPDVGPTGQARASGDIEDYYVLNATAGTDIYLEIGDPDNADVDLWLYTSEGAYVTDSSSRYPGDFVTIQETGTYIVNAHLHSGHGSYALIINEPDAAPQADDQASTSGSKTSTATSTPMNVSAIGTDVGTVYVLLIDAETGVVESVTSTDAKSNYEYDFVLPALGHYYLIAGTDNDNDQSICDADEICGVYGSSGTEVNPINISGAQSGLDVILAPELGVGPLRFTSPMIAN